MNISDHRQFDLEPTRAFSGSMTSVPRHRLPSLADGRVFVVVDPLSLNFYSNDQTTHKRVLSIFNPYDVSLNFKVLCNSNKYMVSAHKGTIEAKSTTKIVIGHNDICMSNEGKVDKFKIEMFEQRKNGATGSRVIKSVLLPKRETPSICEDRFERPIQYVSQSDTPSTAPDRRDEELQQHYMKWLLGAVALCCLLVLFIFPTEGDETTFLSILTLNCIQKFWAALTLGLILGISLTILLTLNL